MRGLTRTTARSRVLSNAAKAGNTLEVKGNCVGNTSVDKNITLKGVTNKTFPGTPTLDGGGTGTVLHITNGTTTVDGLTITNGVATLLRPTTTGLLRRRWHRRER